MREYFPELKSSGGRVTVISDLSNYTTKAELKNARGVQNLFKKVDLANSKSNVGKLDIDKLKNVPSGLSSLKSKVNKLNIGKLKTAPFDLSKLIDTVRNEVV